MILISTSRGTCSQLHQHPARGQAMASKLCRISQPTQTLGRAWATSKRTTDRQDIDPYSLHYDGLHREIARYSPTSHTATFPCYARACIFLPLLSSAVSLGVAVTLLGTERCDVCWGADGVHVLAEEPVHEGRRLRLPAPVRPCAYARLPHPHQVWRVQGARLPLQAQHGRCEGAPQALQGQPSSCFFSQQSPRSAPAQRCAASSPWALLGCCIKTGLPSLVLACLLRQGQHC